MARLSDPVTSLKGGVEPGLSKSSWRKPEYLYSGDLICHFPRAMRTRTKLVPIAQLRRMCPPASGPWWRHRTAHIRKGNGLSKVSVSGLLGRINLAFLIPNSQQGPLQYGSEYIFTSMVSGDYGGYGITNPHV